MLCTIRAFYAAARSSVASRFPQFLGSQVGEEHLFANARSTGLRYDAAERIKDYAAARVMRLVFAVLLLIVGRGSAANQEAPIPRETSG